MFRIKLGEHITFGDISRGPRAVIECDHINEVSDLIKSGVLRTLIDINDAPAKSRIEEMEGVLRTYGIEPPQGN